MILVDTPVLVYAAGGSHPLRRPCQRLVLARRRRRMDAAVSLEVVQEFVWVRAGRRPRSEAVGLAREYMALFHVIVATPRELDLGLELFEHYPRLGSFDCVLAALVLNRQMDALVSSDQAFGEVPGLPWVDPAGPHLDRLLRP